MDFSINLLLFTFSYLIFLFLSIPLHETGHLIGGLLSGYKFSSFRLFSFVWVIEDHRLICKHSKNSMIAGQCLMTPVEDEKNFKYILYNLGGGLVNCLCGVLWIVLLILFYHNQILRPIFVGAISSNLLMGILSLVPFTLIIPNDGMNLLTAGKSKSAKHGLYCMLKQNEMLMKEMRYRDMDMNIFQVDSDADMSSYLAVFPLFVQASYYADIGQPDKGRAALQGINIDALPVHYRNSINLDRLYHYIITDPDYEKARAIYNKSEMRITLNMNHPSIIKTIAVYEFFVNDNQEKGKELLEKAKAAFLSHENKGVTALSMENLLYLEQKMKEST